MKEKTSAAMTTKPSPIYSLALAAVAAIGMAFAITRFGPEGAGSTTPPAVSPPPAWSASAPGRVEPVGGEIRLSALVPGKIIEVAVRVNDQVMAGDLLLRLDDEDARARLVSAEAEAGVRRRERDPEAAVGRLAQDRRQADDNLNAAERSLLTARQELDRLLRQRRVDPAAATENAVNAERSAVTAAIAKVELERAALKRASIAQGIPLQTRLESGLTQARSDLTMAEAAYERTRLRAPTTATVLQVHARVGESVGPSPEQVLIVLGDLSSLRVRAEVEERDVAKIKLGQSVILKTDAYPGQDFTGKVASIAKSLGSAKLPQRGPRRPNDLDTLEVMIDVDQGSAVLPGMRVDVFFKADPVAK